MGVNKMKTLWKRETRMPKSEETWSEKLLDLKIAHVKNKVLQIGSPRQKDENQDVYDGVGFRRNKDGTVNLIAYFEGVYSEVENVPINIIIDYLTKK